MNINYLASAMILPHLFHILHFSIASPSITIPNAVFYLYNCLNIKFISTYYKLSTRCYFVRNIHFSLSSHSCVLYAPRCTRMLTHTHITYTQRLTKTYIFNLHVKHRSDIIKIPENKKKNLKWTVLFLNSLPHSNDKWQ